MAVHSDSAFLLLLGMCAVVVFVCFFSSGCSLSVSALFKFPSNNYDSTPIAIGLTLFIFRANQRCRSAFASAKWNQCHKCALSA